MKQITDYNVIVLGTSAGGMEILHELSVSLPENFSIPIVIVQHVPENSQGLRVEVLNKRSKVRVKEAEEKELIEGGTIYLAPANYHLLLESDLTLTLTVDERENFARPSIDVLFETAAEACKEKLIGVICSGSNSDGARGLQRIKVRGGLTIVQDPETAEARSMPLAAIKATEPDHLVSVDELIKLLLNIHEKQSAHESEDRHTS